MLLYIALIDLTKKFDLVSRGPLQDPTKDRMPIQRPLFKNSTIVSVTLKVMI